MANILRIIIQYCCPQYCHKKIEDNLAGQASERQRWHSNLGHLDLKPISFQWHEVKVCPKQRWNQELRIHSCLKWQPQVQIRDADRQISSHSVPALQINFYFLLCHGPATYPFTAPGSQLLISRLALNLWVSHGYYIWQHKPDYKEETKEGWNRRLSFSLDKNSRVRWDRNFATAVITTEGRLVWTSHGHTSPFHTRGGL